MNGNHLIHNIRVAHVFIVRKRKYIMKRTMNAVGDWVKTKVQRFRLKQSIKRIASPDATKPSKKEIDEFWHEWLNSDQLKGQGEIGRIGEKFTGKVVEIAGEKELHNIAKLKEWSKRTFTGKNGFFIETPDLWGTACIYHRWFIIEKAYPAPTVSQLTHGKAFALIESSLRSKLGKQGISEKTFVDEVKKTFDSFSGKSRKLQKWLVCEPTDVRVIDFDPTTKHVTFLVNPKID